MFSEAILNPQCWCFLEPNRNYVLKMDCEVHHRSISPNNHEHRDTTQKLWWYMPMKCWYLHVRLQRVTNHNTIWQIIPVYILQLQNQLLYRHVASCSHIWLPSIFKIFECMLCNMTDQYVPAVRQLILILLNNINIYLHFMLPEDLILFTQHCYTVNMFTYFYMNYSSLLFVCWTCTIKLLLITLNSTNMTQKQYKP